MARRRNNQGDPASLLSCYHFHVLISEPAYFFFTSCDVVQTCSLSFISYDGGVFFLSPTLQLSSLQLSLSMLLTPRRESRGSIYLALASTCVSISGNAKVTRIFTDTRNGFEHIISDPLVFSPSSLYFLLFSLHDLRHMTWERSLLSKGNGNGNGNTGVNHCFIFLLSSVCFFLFSVCFFYFLPCFLHGTVFIYVTLWSSIYLIPRCHAYRTWVLFLTLLDRYTDFTCNGKCCLCRNLGHVFFLLC